MSRVVKEKKKMFSLYLIESPATYTQLLLSKFDKVNDQWINVFFKIVVPFPNSNHKTIHNNP